MAASQVRQTVLLEHGSTSCSGIILSTKHGLIVTHASLLLPFFSKHRGIYREFLKKGCLSAVPEAIDTCSRNGLVKVTCELLIQSIVRNESGSVIPDSAYHTPLTKHSAHNQSRLHFKGKVRNAWLNNEFSTVLSRLFSSTDKWTFTDEPNYATKSNSAISKESEMDDETVNIAVSLLPCFVLIGVDESLREFALPSAVFSSSIDSPCIGQSAVIVGTPFGNLSPEVFLNSVSKGVVSNVAGSKSELLLTDARCIPGTEGGALYLQSSSRERPYGLVVAPLCWKAGEWIGMSIVCSMFSVLRSLELVHPPTGCIAAVDREKQKAPMEHMFSDVGVVLVCSRNGSWGSGIIVDWSEGLVLTCSHVVKTDRQVEVRVSSPVACTYTANVITASKGDQVFDLALLKMQKFGLRGKQICYDQHPKEGDDVFMLGHAAWGISQSLKASVTSGIVSKVVYHSDRPVIIQTSCCVNAGASGGPVVNRSGHLIGLAVCNARDTANGAWYPHVNLCVPSAVLCAAVSRYVTSGDALQLKRDFRADDDAIDKLWLLQSGPIAPTTG